MRILFIIVVASSLLFASTLPIYAGGSAPDPQPSSEEKTIDAHNNSGLWVYCQFYLGSEQNIFSWCDGNNIRPNTSCRGAKVVKKNGKYYAKNNYDQEILISSLVCGQQGNYKNTSCIGDTAKAFASGKVVITDDNLNRKPCDY